MKNRYVTEARAASVAKCFALVGAYILSGLPYFFETVPWCAFVASGLFWGSSFFSGLYIYISDGAAAAVALGADPPEFRPVFWLCT